MSHRLLKHSSLINIRIIKRIKEANFADFSFWNIQIFSGWKINACFLLKNVIRTLFFYDEFFLIKIQSMKKLYQRYLNILRSILTVIRSMNFTNSFFRYKAKKSTLFILQSFIREIFRHALNINIMFVSYRFNYISIHTWNICTRIREAGRVSNCSIP